MFTTKYNKIEALKYLIKNRMAYNYLSDVDMYEILVEIIESKEEFFHIDFLNRLLLLKST